MKEKINQEDWYYQAVTNAQNAGIIYGSNGMFRPLDIVSRQEAVVILYRAYKIEGSFLSSTKFQDDIDIASWAKNQVSVLNDLRIIKGRSETLFEPLANLTRAEAVKLIDNISIYYEDLNQDKITKQPSEKIDIETPNVPDNSKIPISSEKPSLSENNPAENTSTKNNSAENISTENATSTGNTSSEYYSAADLNGKLIKVLPGLYNIAFTEDFISLFYPTLTNQDKLNIKINNSINIDYEIIYFEYIPAIHSSGWLAYNIQGSSESDILNGIISIKK